MSDIPLQKKQCSLKTRDKKTALKYYKIISRSWEDELAHKISSQLEERLTDLAKEKSEGDNIHLCDFIKQWRVNILGFIKNSDGTTTLNETKVRVLRGSKGGDFIRQRMQIDYGRQCVQLENEPDCRFPINDKNAVKNIRKLLKPWLDKTTHYNHLKATLSRVFDHAIKSGDSR